MYHTHYNDVGYVQVDDDTAGLRSTSHGLSGTVPVPVLFVGPGQVLYLRAAAVTAR
jgi:hypothetical protein